MFVDEMDMLDLTRWRLTCRANYHQAVGSLQRSVINMLRPFVLNPLALLDIITKHQAVLGGEFALAFVLRDASMLPMHLDIYASDFEFDHLCTAIMSDDTLRSAFKTHESTNNSVLDALRTLISSTLVITTTRGTTIHIHRSYTISPSAPISRASCTALSNFVTAYGFGCSHPLLTLNRRALLADQEIPELPFADRKVQQKLLTHKFSLAVSPTAWPEFRRTAIPVPLQTLVFHNKDSTIIRTVVSDTQDAGPFGLDVVTPSFPGGYVMTIKQTDVVASSGQIIGADEATQEDPPPPLHSPSTDATVHPNTQSGVVVAVDTSSIYVVPSTPRTELDNHSSSIPSLDDPVHMPACSGDIHDFHLEEPTGAQGADYIGATAPELSTAEPPVAPDAGLPTLGGTVANVGSTDDRFIDGEDTDVDHPLPEQCWRHRYICPSQGRYFGDRGSFVDFFDPLSGAETFCVDNNIAPFGPMMVWRLLSTFDCEECCDIHDDVLGEEVTSIPVIMRKDPFGELQDVVSGHKM